MNEELNNIDPDLERLDQATSARLRKLRTIPVETANLRQAVEALVPPPQSRTMRLTRIWRIGAAAASLVLICALAAVVLFWSGQPVLASPARLAALHEHNLAGPAHATAVGSLDAASAVLSQQWPEAPALPKVEGCQVTACCIHHLGRKKLACVCLDAEGTPVSLVVADADDVKAAPSRPLVINGVKYQVHSSSGVTMLMAEHEGRWVCIMGRLPAERLARLAGNVRF